MEPFAEGAPGTTGASGASGAAAQTAARPTRTQLNEMTKDDLLAVAAAEGAEVNQGWVKADIVDAIIANR
jgi:hypothetical protein